MGGGTLRRPHCALALVVALAAMQGAAALQHWRFAALHTASTAAQVLLASAATPKTQVQDHSLTATCAADAEASDSQDWVYILQFNLPLGRAALAAMRKNVTLLDFLLSHQPRRPSDVRPAVVYAGVVGERDLNQTNLQNLPQPDPATAWHVAAIVRFPPNSRARPGDLGAGVAQALYCFRVAPLPLPDQALAGACADSPALAEVEQEEKAAQDAMVANFFKWKKDMDASDGTKPLMIPLYPSISGLNLLKYKARALGAPCYHRYLHGVTELIHKYGGGILYYATVVKNATLADVHQWDEIVIPIYDNGTAFFNVVLDPAYRGLLAVRDASLADSGNIDINGLEGGLRSVM